MCILCALIWLKWSWFKLLLRFLFFIIRVVFLTVFIFHQSDLPQFSFFFSHFIFFLLFFRFIIWRYFGIFFFVSSLHFLFLPRNCVCVYCLSDWVRMMPFYFDKISDEKRNLNTDSFQRKNKIKKSESDERRGVEEK